VKYLGVRWMRSGIESDVPIEDVLALHRGAGVRFSWGLLSGQTDLDKLLATGRQLADAGALLAFGGLNEPNNWGITYQGEEGGRAKSWLPVARIQRDLYQKVKSDPILKKYPVFSLSEPGAQTDNVGLQFLTIPKGAGTLMPDGTRYADYANVHNYIYHPNSPNVEDNKTWNAAEPGPESKVDGLFGNHGVTWGRKYKGYSEAELRKLPRVTTETGTTIGGAVTEEIHALNLLSMYLAQFKRGWAYTNVYLLRDRVDEGGNQQFGFYRPDYTPRPAAVYLHNLTTILADSASARNSRRRPGRLRYSIPQQPATVHDLLLQKSDGTFALVVWGERVQGSDEVTLRLGARFPRVQVFDPTKGTTPIQSHSQVDSLRLTLSDHPLIVMMPPNARG
jgi:hypothetical protein